jgi:molybdate transport system substrate-binding protein
MTRIPLTLALAFLLAACGKREPSPDTIKVGAASDLSYAFEELGAEFTRKTGKKVVFSFGSTGLLAKQLAEGAPYDVFAAANVSYVDEVVKAGACDGATQAMYARGRIVLWSGDAVKPAPQSLADLTDARFVKLAIANPDHAPYGKAAKQALETAGLWDAIEPRLVYGENIKQTLQSAETGNADAAFAALSLAIVTKGGNYFVIDDALHKPIDQALVVCKHGGNPAVGADFARYVNSEEGRAIMKRYGFLLPGETLVSSPSPTP